MPEHATIAKNTQTTKEPQPKIKLFLSDVLIRHGGSAEDMANKWLISNAGKVKVYDIVYQHPNIASCDMAVSCVGIIYQRQRRPIALTKTKAEKRFYSH